MKNIIIGLKIYGNINGNYENGWDIIIEAFTDAEIEEVLIRENLSGLDEAKVYFENYFELLRNRDIGVSECIV